MKRKYFFATLTTILAVGVTLAMLWPEEADARMGGGNSMGSRGSRSFSTPRQAIPAPAGGSQMHPGSAQPAQAMPGSRAPLSTPGMAGSPGFSSGLMGGLGGLVLGGVLGAALFGGEHTAGGMGEGAAHAAGGVGGSGIGLLELLLIGGLIWMALRWFKQQRAGQAAPMAPYGNSRREDMADAFSGKSAFDSSPGRFMAGQEDELAQGIANIVSMDPQFEERRFLEGAKMAFQHIQGAWSDWSVDRLRPLLTERMWKLIQAQALERQAAGKRDIIEKIQFDQVSISEAWQEAGEDWLTVHFLVRMVDYTTDTQGKLLEGDPNTPSTVEEYWTFTRPVGSRDPNWFLSAIQQPGEVAKSVV